MQILSKKLLVIPAILVGVVILMMAVKFRATPDTKPAVDRARAVEVMTLKQQPLAPVATAFGRVAPKVEWQAIAEVSGKVIYRHPELEKGRVLKAGTVILKIDPLDYQLRLAQAQADVSSSEAQLAKLDLDEKNLKMTLSVEKNRLAISKKELARKKELRKKGLTSQSELDLEQQSRLVTEKAVLDIESQLNVMPKERKVTEAQLAVAKSQLAEAQRSLDKTVITLPIDARVSTVNIELDQVVNTQQAMVIAQGLNAVEIDAQLAIHDYQVLAASLSDTKGELNLGAQIQLSSGAYLEQWSATVTRISDTVNEDQATIGMILEVTQDQAQLSNGVPTLVKGMFVEAELTGQQQPHWVIPERALHGDTIYQVTKDNTLQLTQIEVLFRSGNQVAISGDFDASLPVVLNDLLPAVRGMKLRVISLDDQAVVESNEQGAEGDSAL